MVLISTLHLYEIDWNEISKISGISFYTINKKKQFQCNKIKYATIKRKNAHNLRYKINQIDLPLIVCTSDYPPTKQTFFCEEDFLSVLLCITLMWSMYRFQMLDQEAKGP